MTQIKLRVGGTYLAQDGETVTIHYSRPSNRRPLERLYDSGGLVYFQSGLCPGMVCQDLIKELTPFDLG